MYGIRSFTDKRFVCYHTYWSTWRPFPANFDVADIDPFLCTHLIYAFAEVVWYSWDLRPFAGDSLDNYDAIVALKQINPDLIVMLAVGGWGQSGFFDFVTANTDSRRLLINNVYDFLVLYGFDGLDLDWEFPTNIQQKQQFTWLCEVRHAGISHSIC